MPATVDNNNKTTAKTITYISLLRGINVSGHNKLKMDALKKMYEKFGFKKVKTYLQSGNIIFQNTDCNHNKLDQLISMQIKKDFELQVPVTVLTVDQMERIIKNNPFLKDLTKDISFLHVTFLASQPEDYDNESITSRIAKGEDIVITDSAVYLYCPDGYGKTKLTNSFIESRLKVSATTRNWKSANEILRIAQEI